MAIVQKIFSYLLTDQQVIGGLAWIGVLATIIGLAIAIDQIRKVKRAADAAATATRELGKAVHSRERLLELNSAAALIGNAKDYIAQRNFGYGILFIDLALPQCAQVHELLKGEDRNRMYLIILRLKNLSGSLLESDNELLRDSAAVPLAVRARDIIAEMNALGAKLRYRYDQERL